MLMSKKRRAVRTVGWYIGAVLICCITVFPFLWMIATSFKTVKEIYDNSLSLIPQQFTWENYFLVFNEIPFGRYILNSLFLALTLSFTNVFFGALAGYAFAKMRFRGKQVAFLLLISSMMMPGIVTMLPSFLVLKNFPLAGGNNIWGQGGSGFINTYWAILLPRCVGAYSCFFMRQFFETLPNDLAESARIDGCNEFGIFTRIYFPLIRPAVITLFIMNFQSGWNSFMWPSIVLNKPEIMTIQVGLRAFKYEYDTNYGALMAGTVIATVPLLIIFSFAQRYYVQGIAFSGGKE